MSIFGSPRPISIDRLSIDSLKDLKDKIEDELKERNEYIQGTSGNTVKQIKELLELKENQNKYLVFNTDEYLKIISVADTDVDCNCCGNHPSNFGILLYRDKGGIEYGIIGDTWKRIEYLWTRVSISLFDTTNAIEVVKNSLKTKEEVLEIIQNHLNKCGEEFVKHHFDIAKSRLNLK